MDCPRCQGTVTSEYVVDVRQYWIRCIMCGHLAPEGGFVAKVSKKEICDIRDTNVDNREKLLEKVYMDDVRSRLAKQGGIYGFKTTKNQNLDVLGPDGDTLHH